MEINKLLGPAHEAWATAGSQRKAAKALGITRDSLKNKLEREKEKQTARPAIVKSEADKYEAILGLLSGTLDPPARSSNVKSIIGLETDSLIPVFLWSDWHCGETVDPEQVFGFNEFNAKIAEQRVNTLISKSLSLARHESKSNKAILWLGGDFCSGWLWEELVATDYCTPLEAVHWSCTKLYNAILDLLSEFKSLEIVCSPGNHARLTKRPVGKQNAYTAFDWLIYSQLKSWLGERSGLSFSIPAEGDCLININNHGFFFTHGNNIGTKGGSGEIGVIGPIVRGRSRILNAMSSLSMPFQTLIMGHVHQNIWMPGRGIIINPCLVGFNEYAKMNRFIAEPPSQQLFFVHKEYGPILPITIYL